MTKEEISILKYHFNVLGGLEKQTNSIVTELLNKGYKVTVITTKPKSPILDVSSSEINFHFVKIRTFFSFFKILLFELKTSSLVKKNRPKIILGIDRTTAQTHIRAGNGTHKAYLEKRKKYFGFLDYISCITNPLHLLILHIEKKAFESSFLQKIITNSEMVKSEILKFYKVDPSKINVIHNGTAWEKLQKSFEESFSEKIKIAGKLKIDPNKYNFLFIGNGYKRKGLNSLLKASSILKKKNNEFNLLIIGKDKNIKKYKKYANSLGLAGNAIFFGEQKNVLPFYQIADAFVQPSYYDPFANTTVEALAMGVFTITSKENGGKEIINNENGIIIDDLLNDEDTALCLEKAIKTPKSQERALIIRNSVKHLELSTQLDKVIKTLLNND